MPFSFARPEGRTLYKLSAALISVALIATLDFASTTLASARFTRCGAVDRAVAVVAHGVGCQRARRVAADYLNGQKNPIGFRCRRYSVAAAAGWYAKCTRRSSYVQVIPE